MPRKPHKIMCLNQRLHPRLVLCVQATTRRTYAGEADEWGAVALAGWAIAACEINGHRVGEPSIITGLTVRQFWDTLASHWGNASERLIVSVGAREHCAVLGLWDRLLDGTYAVRGYDPTSTRDASGFVVLESPPTIVLFSSVKAAKHYTWIDPRNYGVRFPCETVGVDDPTSELCLTVAKEVASWFKQFLAKLKDTKLGNLAHTAAGQAAAGFRQSYMDHAIYVHDNEAVLNMERAALFGGRNECRFVGTVLTGDEPEYESKPDVLPNWQAGLYDGPPEVEPEPEGWGKRAVIAGFGKIVQLDFNSLYPSVAQDAMLPVKLLGVVKNPSVAKLLDACKATPVIATVRIKTHLPTVPVWVKRQWDDDGQRSATKQAVSGDQAGLRMIFPTGNFNAVLCGPEIQLAAKLGTIVSCGVMAAYEGRPIYRRWVSELYACRRQLTNDGMPKVADCIKAIMNASFAKWAQLKRRWVDVPQELCPWPWDQWYRQNKETDDLEQWRAFAWAVQRLETAGEPGDSCPAITAYINSLGRVKLWDTLAALGDEEVFYYDTDSVWTTEYGRTVARDCGMLDQTVLGKLKVAGEYDAVEIFGLKRYFADGHLTIAGADGETVRTSDAWALALRAPPTHSYLRMHRPPGIDRRTARMRLSLPYRHGVLQPSGWVEPWTVIDN